MKKNLLKLALAAACVAATASCITVYEVKDSGMIKKQVSRPSQPTKLTILGGELEDFPLSLSSEFTSIVSSVPVNIVFTQGEQFEAKAIVPKSLYDTWSVKVENGTLRLSLPDGNYEYDKSSFRGKYPTVYITNRTLARVAVSSSGNLRINGPLNVDSDFTYSVAGSGDFTAEEVTAPQGSVTIQVAGSGDTKINTLQAQSFNVDIAGAGDVKCPAVDTNLCRIAIAGAGDAKIGGRSNTVNFGVAGAGSIDAATLTAEVGHANVSGIGSVKCNVKNLTKTVSGLGKVTNKIK